MPVLHFKPKLLTLYLQNSAYRIWNVHAEIMPLLPLHNITEFRWHKPLLKALNAATWQDCISESHCFIHAARALIIQATEIWGFRGGHIWAWTPHRVRAYRGFCGEEAARCAIMTSVWNSQPSQDVSVMFNSRQTAPRETAEESLEQGS